MNDKVIGFVLKQQDYKENALIVTVLTKEFGKISFVAAGAKKMTSKNASGLLPYTSSSFQFDYSENRTMFRCKTARCIEAYKSIHQDLEKSSAAAVLGEIADALSLPGTMDENAAAFFDVLALGWKAIDQGKDTVTVLALGMASFLQIVGMGPEVDACVLCGNPKVSALDAQQGGFLCSSCAKQRQIPLKKVEDLRRFRLIVKAGLEHYSIVEQAGGAKMEDVNVLLEFFRLHAGVPIRSFSFYQRVLSVENRH